MYHRLTHRRHSITGCSTSDYHNPTRKIMLRTESIEVLGTAAAKILMENMLFASMWFEFTPLPDDYYEFKIKSEAKDQAAAMAMAAIKQAGM